MTDYKQEFLTQLAMLKIQVEPEFRFHPERKWRADWVVLDHHGKRTKILIEYEGGLFMKSKSGHTSINGIHRDAEKANEASLMGFTLLRITPKHVVSGQALQWVERALRGPFYVEQ